MRASAFPPVAALICAAAWPASALSGPSGADLRRVGEEVAAAGAAERDPALLIAGLRLLLENGATIAADDPWGAAGYLALLREIDRAEGNAFAGELARLSAVPRGTVSGPSRVDAVLEPAAEQRFRLTVVGAEAAIVEARLKAGSGAADIDMTVTDTSGRVLAEDLGAPGGTLGHAAYAEFHPESCTEIEVRLVNRGPDPARVALIAPPAATARCDP